MKKRILSLVLCAAMLLSMCLFLGAGVMDDTTADGSAETTESYIPAVNFTNVAPFVQANAQMANGPARAPLRASTNDGSTTPTDPSRKISDAVVTEKTATKNADGTYTIKLTSYTTGTVTEQTTTKPTDIVLVLDQSGSMATKDMTVSDYTAYTNTTNSNLYSKGSNLWYKQGDSYVQATVTRTEGYNDTLYNGQTNGTYYDNRNNLYAYVNGQLQRVTVSETWHIGGREYIYKIAGSGTTIAESKGKSSKPAFSGIDGGKLYLRTSYYEYAYSYTDNGVKVSLGTSTGADAQFKDATLYQKTDRKITRLDALKTAATNFVNQIAQKAEAEGVDHRIAVVSYASSASNKTNGFVDMRTGGASVTTAIDGLSANGGTLIDEGIETANTIFSANPIEAGKERNRVMIVFTDGAPGLYGDWCSASVETANNAIANAKVAKDTHNATVYTIGIFPGADASAALPDYTSYTEDYYDEYAPSDADQIKNSNRFMHLVSSEYLGATNIETPGNRNPNMKDNNGYYLSAGDASALTEIFQKIGDNISTPSIELGSKAEVRDIVSPYFTAPANADGITVYAEKAGPDGSGGYSWEKDKAYTDGAKMKAEVNGQAVTVSGFDYDANFVSQTGRKETNPKESGDFHGRRLVVEFNVTVKPEFLGGNFVPTNLPTSGVYDENGNVVENFAYPRVNIPVKAPALTGESKNIYYNGERLTAEDLCTANIAVGMADYVDLSYSVDKAISNTEDGNYIVTVTATPKYPIAGQPQQPKSAEANATVNVFTPEITFNDSRINYGATANYTNNGGVVVWKHGNEEAANANMTGEKPVLAYTYDPEASAFTKDTYVKVTVSANGEPLPVSAVTFRHDDNCGFPGCSFDPEQGQFIVHINVFDLRIVKAEADDSKSIDPKQTFVFKVKNNGNGKTMEVVITGPGEQTIKNLPVGDYTITEDTSWSWKYTPDGDATQELKAGSILDGVATVTFKNKNNGTNWLTSLAQVINTWVGGNAHEKIN